MGAVIALTDVGAKHLVFVGQRAQRGERFRFAARCCERPQRQGFTAADVSRNHGIHQRFARSKTECREHLVLFARGWADMPFDKGIVAFQRVQGGAVHQVGVIELHVRVLLAAR